MFFRFKLLSASCEFRWALVVDLDYCLWSVVSIAAQPVFEYTPDGRRDAALHMWLRFGPTHMEALRLVLSCQAVPRRARMGRAGCTRCRLWVATLYGDGDASILSISLR